MVKEEALHQVIIFDKIVLHVPLEDDKKEMDEVPVPLEDGEEDVQESDDQCMPVEEEDLTEISTEMDESIPPTLMGGEHIVAELTSSVEEHEIYISTEPDEAIPLTLMGGQITVTELAASVEEDSTVVSAEMDDIPPTLMGGMPVIAVRTVPVEDEDVMVMSTEAMESILPTITVRESTDFITYIYNDDDEDVIDKRSRPSVETEEDVNIRMCLTEVIAEPIKSEDVMTEIQVSISSFNVN